MCQPQRALLCLQDSLAPTQAEKNQPGKTAQCERSHRGLVTLGSAIIKTVSLPTSTVYRVYSCKGGLCALHAAARIHLATRNKRLDTLLAVWKFTFMQ